MTAPQLVTCRFCGKPMPVYREKEGGCRKCVRERVDAALRAGRP